MRALRSSLKGLGDLLDAFGGDAMGKQIGGDILSNKKTFLRLHYVSSVSLYSISRSR